METESEVTFVRIYLHEADHGRRRNLMQEILTSLKEQHRVHGITVFRGIAGVSEDGSEVQAADILRLMVDLPLVVEFYDEPAVAAGVIKTLNGLLTGHSIICWPARVIRVTESATSP
jgi:PII-like signaling protein